MEEIWEKLNLHLVLLPQLRRTVLIRVIRFPEKKHDCEFVNENKFSKWRNLWFCSSKKDDTSFTTRFRVGGRVLCNFALHPLSSVLPACNYSECRLRWIYSAKENSNFSTLRNFLLSFFGEFAIRPPVRLLHLCTYLWVFEEEQIAASFGKRAITASLIRISANLRSNASHYWFICTIWRFLFNYKLQSCRLFYVAHRRGSR